jgi:elongation factor Ts
MQITAQLVNDLRKRTNIGMMECKKALVATDGDMEAAIEYLRKAGIVKAEEKSGRAANNGIIVGVAEGNAAVLLEFLCETDFVAKTADFKDFGKRLAEAALKYDADGDVTEQLNAEHGEEVKAFVGKIKENMQVRRVVRWKSDGTLGYYLHSARPFGSMVEVEGKQDKDLVAQICMQIVASEPEYIDVKDIPAEKVAKEREIALAQVPADKPEKMKEGIANGKLSKWYTTVCLMKQPWIMDDKTTLEKVAPGLKVKRMIRWLAGEDL